MKVFCFHCECWHVAGDCAFTVKGGVVERPDSIESGNVQSVPEPASETSQPFYEGSRRCSNCRIELSPISRTRERTEADKPMCDVCRCLVESVGQPTVKDWFINAHLEWEQENDRRTGLINGRR